MVESAFLLLLVIDPFGNLPFVLSVLSDVSPADYRRIILRETALAFAVLLVFALVGDQILGYLKIQGAALSVAGGVILFLISLKMIFSSSQAIFDSRYRDDPLLVPIAVPSLSGPSAITTVMILRTDEQVPLAGLLLAMALVFLVTCLIFLLGRRINTILGERGVHAMEKFMGLLLNLVAVNMTLAGIKAYLS